MNVFKRVILMACLLAASTSMFAQRYWVGGTGNWSSSSHWSAASGGAGGAGVPSPTDDVFFDENSGFGMVTLDVTGNAKSVDFTGCLVSGSSSISFYGLNTSGIPQTLNVYGDFILDPNVSFTIGVINFSAAFPVTPNIDFADNDFSYSANPTTLKFSGGGTYNLLSNGLFNYQNVDISVDNGTLNTNGFDFKLNNFYINAATPTTVNLGNSIITAINFSTNSLSTLNAGSSTIILNGTTSILQGGNKVYNNIQTTGTTSSSISGDNTINNLDVRGTTLVTGTNTITNIIHNYAKRLTLPRSKTQTLTGNYLSLGLSGNQAILTSDLPGTPALISKSGGTVNLSYMQISSINFIGTAAYNLNSLSCNVSGCNLCTSGTGCLNNSVSNNNVNVNGIAMTTLLDRPLINGAFNVSASSSAGLPVTLTVSGAANPVVFTSTAGNPAVVAVTPTTAGGLITLTASSGGNVSYFPASSVIRTFRAVKSKPTINLTTDKTGTFVSGGMPPFDMSSSSTGGASAFSIHRGNNGTINSSNGQVTVTGAGTLFIKSTVAANSYYYAGSAIIGKLTIALANPVITFASISKYTTDPDFTISATSTSPGAITYTLTGNPTVATLSGALVHLGGTAGNVSLNACVAATTNYNAGCQIATLNVSALTIPTLTLSNISKVYGSPNFSLMASTNSPGAITYSLLSGTGATVSSSGQVTITGVTGVGTPMQVQASQAASGSYAATSVIATLTITPLPITVTASQSKVYGASDPATFNINTTPSLIPGDSFTGTLTRAPGENVGNYLINQGTLSAGPNYTITIGGSGFTISPANPVITFGSLSKNTTDLDFTVSATSTSPGAITYTLTGNPTVATLSGALVHLGGTVGSVTLNACVSATTNYNAGCQPATLNVLALTIPTLTLSNISTTYGNAAFNLSTSTSTNSPGAITYSLVSGTGATVNSSGQDTITGVGTPMQVQASQAASGSYAATSVMATLTIAPRAVTITGIQANGKPYDGNITATLNNVGTLSGVLGSDLSPLPLVNLDASTIQANFTSKNVGPNQVSITNYKLSGPSSGNYILTSSMVTVSGTISPIPATVNGISVFDKVYNGNSTATIVGTPQLSGKIAGDNFVLDASSATASFISSNVGLQNVYINSYSVSGGDAGNYIFSQPSLPQASITKKLLNLSPGSYTAINRAYNGNTNATITGPMTLMGIVGSDDVTLDTSTGTASFSSKDVGAKSVTLSNYGLKGLQSGNYSLSPIPNTTGNITTKPVAIFGVIALDKVYDGNNTATPGVDITVPLGKYGSVGGAVFGENVFVVQGSATFGSKDSGMQGVTFTGFSLGGSDVGNYALTAQPSSVSATINQKPLTVINTTVLDKVYDRTVTATTSSTPTISGVVGLENVTLSNGTISFSDKNAGTGKTVSFSNFFLGGTDAYNYMLIPPSNTTADITPKSITVTVTAGQSKIYGATDPAIFNSNTASLLISGDSFTGSLTRAPGQSVGPYLISQGTLSAGPNYTIIFVGSSFGITAKPITVTVTSGQGKVYGAIDPSLVYTSTPSLISGDSFTGSLTRAPGASVNGYAISQGSLSAGPNYTITFVGSSFGITAKPITVTATSGQGKVYGAIDPSLVYTSTPSLISGDSFTGSLARVAGESVNGYTISQGTLSAGPNYTISFTGSSFGITAKPITVTATSGQGKVFGGIDPSLVYTSTPSLISGDSFTGSLTRVAGESVNGYTISQGTLSAGPNYAITFVGSSFGITAKPITVIATSGQGKVYGGIDPSLVYTSTPSLISGDSFTGSLTRVAGESVNGYTISQGSLSAGPNYTITFVGSSFGITAKPITVTATSGQGKVYGAIDPSLVYTSTPSLISGDTFTGSLTRAAGESVGPYLISQGTLTAGPNYTITFAGSSFTINPANPLIVFSDLSKNITDPNFTLGATSTSPGAITFTDLTLNSSIATLSGTSVHLGGSTGTVNLQACIAATTNYNALCKTAILNVSALPVPTLTYNNINLSYGAPAFDLSPSSSNSNGLITYSVLSGVAATVNAAGHVVIIGAGPAVQVQASQAATASFAANSVNFTITVAPVAITVTAASGQSKVYGAADPAFGYTVNPSLLGSDSFTGSLSRAAGEGVSSNYTINQGTLSAGPNYTLTFIGNTFGITPKAITVTVTASQSKIYGAVDPTLAYTVNPSLLGSDLFTGSLSRVSGEGVGSNYVISQGTLSAGSNYSLAFVGNAFAITAKPVTVSVTAGQSKIYGSADPALTYTVNPLLLGSDQFTGSLSRVSGEGVGSNYAINQGTLSAGPNYSLTFVGNTFGVTAKSVTVTVTAGQSKVYGSADPVFTYSASPLLLGSDQFKGSLSRVAGENVNSYAINQGTLSAGSNYNITFVADNFGISKATPAITFNDLIKSNTAGDFALNATSTPTGTINYTDVSSNGLIVLSGATVHLNGGIGLVNLQACTPPTANYNSVCKTATLTISNLPIPVVTLNDVSKKYGDPSFDLIATSNSNGVLAYSVLTGSSATVSTTGHVVITGIGQVQVQALQSSTSSFGPSVAIATITITQGDAVISNFADLTKTINDVDFDLNAATNSDGIVSYQLLTGNAVSLSGKTIHILGSGITTLRASVPSTANFLNASQDITLTINKLSQTISFASLAKMKIGDPDIVMGGSSNSGLPVSYTSSNLAVATVTGNTLKIVGAGTADITASQGGNSVYSPAPDVKQVLIVDKNSQTITFGTLSPRTFGGGSFAISAMSSSLLPVTFTVASGPATIANNQVTLTGAGDVVIKASQAGNANYLAANDVTQTFTVSKATQIITFGALSTKAFASAPFTLSATTSSSLPVTFSITSGPATVTGNTITLTGAGSVIVKASQTGNANYSSAADISQTFCVTPATPTITASFVDPEIPVLTSSSTTGNQWYLNGTAISGATSNTLGAAQAGVYTVSVTIGGCASAVSSTMPVVVTGVFTKEEPTFSFYPNPVADELTIKFSIPEEVRSVVILDVSGKSIDGGGNDLLNRKIDTANYPQGLYIIQVKTNRQIYSKRFVKR
jgi:hypothetical protein